MHCIGGNLFVIMDKKNSRSIEGLNLAITIYLNKRIIVITTVCALEFPCREA